MGKKTETDASTPARAADAKPSEAPAQPGGKGMKKNLFFGFGILGLVGVGLAVGILIAPLAKKSAAAGDKKPSTTAEQIAGDAAVKGEEGAKKEGEAKPGAEPERFVFDFKKNFTTNLLDPTGRQLIQVTIQVEAASAEAKTALEKNEVPLRHATNMLLGSKTLAELQGAGGMERLTNELRLRYEGVLNMSGAIKEISYADLLFLKQ